jgi:hypothetical protein
VSIDDLVKETREKVKGQRYAFPMFGVECGKGWEKLYGPLFQLCKLLDINVAQVKEKFGGLRFYVGDVPEEYYDMVYAFISAIEADSYHVCEECGIRNRGYRDEDKTYTSVKVTTEGDWMLTLCEECRQKRDERRQKEEEYLRAAYNARQAARGVV